MNGYRNLSIESDRGNCAVGAVIEELWLVRSVNNEVQKD